MITLRTVIALLAFVSFASAHIVISYPGWRGDNLHANGSYNVDDYKPDLFPYGMQWMYPCKHHPSFHIRVQRHAFIPRILEVRPRTDLNLTGGGLRITSNRTYWPTTGGAVAFQPGWFQGHKTALLYINLGLGNVPENYSLPMQKQWQITGPDNEAYPGSEICMPQVPLPANVTVKEGDNATIQVVESAQHGAALYSVCSHLPFCAINIRY